MQIYVVKTGDTIDEIALRQDVPVESIIYNNQLEYPYALVVGQALLLPGSADTGQQDNAEEIPKGLVEVNGYAYPFIRSEILGQQDTAREIPKRLEEVNGYAYPFIRTEILEQTLPYLTEVSVFSYGFTEEGELIEPEISDALLLETAINFQTAPILTLTPFGADGQFNNYLIHRIVTDPVAQNHLIENLLNIVRQKQFEGVDIDFEYILAEDRIAFAEFVANVRNAMSPEGYSTSVALAPKISDDQPGLLYGGKDYALLGEAADKVLLMTYEWGYTYGPPMAVAPIHKVEEVVQYALTRIPAEKINMGIPNYGYDWPLPYERGVTKARTLGNVEAVRLAIDKQAEIMFDQTAMSPYFHYEENGILHEVWFEDVRSLQAKFGLVLNYRLRGMGYWQIMSLFRANWLLLSDTFWIAK